MSNLPPPPTRGKPPNRRVLIIGGVAAAGIVYWAYKKNKASAVTATSTDPNIDPTTGLPYSSGSYGSGGAVGTSPSLYGYTDQFGSLISSGTGSVVTAPSTNAAWAQQAASYLVANGYSGAEVLGALGKYLAGLNLTDTEMATIQAAIAVEGNPPVAVPPPHVAPPTGQTSSQILPPGYYFYVALGSFWMVDSNGHKRRLIPQTWAQLNKEAGGHQAYTVVGPTNLSAFLAAPRDSDM